SRFAGGHRAGARAPRWIRARRRIGRRGARAARRSAPRCGAERSLDAGPGRLRAARTPPRSRGDRARRRSERVRDAGGSGARPGSRLQRPRGQAGRRRRPAPDRGKSARGLNLMRRVHDMPFGAAVGAERGVVLRLGARGAEGVGVWLVGGDARPLPMTGPEGGWYVARTDLAPPGPLYQFVIDGELAVPDPAPRFQPRDVHGPSEVIDPA